MTSRQMDDDIEDCRQAAIRAGVLLPRGFGEGAAANWLSNQNKSWADTAVARQRLHEAIKECMRRKGYVI